MADLFALRTERVYVEFMSILQLNWTQRSNRSSEQWEAPMKSHKVGGAVSQYFRSSFSSRCFHGVAKPSFSCVEFFVCAELF